VRPLSEAGKLRMVRDISVLEFAVGEKLYPVEQLGAPYRAVRAFRPLLFLETEQFPNSPLLHVSTRLKTGYEAQLGFSTAALFSSWTAVHLGFSAVGQLCSWAFEKL
jgi:hypothetical protein